MEPSDDRRSTKMNMTARNSPPSDSDGSSLVSCGSAAISLIDSQDSDRESQVSDVERRLLDAGPAPPDYAQATANRTPLPSRPVDEESLDSRNDNDTSFHLLSHNRKHKGLKRLLRQHWKRLCLINLAIYCIITTILLIVGLVISRKASFRQSVAVQALDNFPPDHPLNQRDNQAFFHQNTPQCEFTSYPGDYYFFGWTDPDSFHFEEALLASRYKDHHNFDVDVSITGNIEIRPAPYGESSPISVIVSYASNSAWQAGLPAWEKDSNFESLRIHNSPPRDRLMSQNKQRELSSNAGVTSSNGKACLDVWVGIYVQTQLDNFSVRTENLNVDIGSFSSYQRGWSSFRIRDESEVYAKVGNMTVDYWDGRNAKFTSESGFIKGEFGLNDNLHLETKSGDIVAQIWGQAAHEYKYLASHPPGSPANLTTVTETGKQSLEVVQGLNEIVWGERLGYGYPWLLQSSHHSGSGTISVSPGMYWGGQIHAVSNNGSINLGGNELRIIPNPIDEIGRGDELKEVWAEKGPWNSSMLLETRDGDIRVCVEEEWECQRFLPDLNRFLYPDWPELWGDEDAKT